MLLENVPSNGLLVPDEPRIWDGWMEWWLLAMV